jgi:hypothetical protein
VNVGQDQKTFKVNPMFWTYQKVMDRIKISQLELNQLICIYPAVLDFIEEYSFVNVLECFGGVSEIMDAAVELFCSKVALIAPDIFDSETKAWMSVTDENGDPYTEEEVRRFIMRKVLIGTANVLRVRKVHKQPFSRFFIDPYLLNAFKEVIPSNLKMDHLGSVDQPCIIHFPDRSILTRDLGDGYDSYTNSAIVFPSVPLSDKNNLGFKSFKYKDKSFNIEDAKRQTPIIYTFDMFKSGTAGYSTSNFSNAQLLHIEDISLGWLVDEFDNRSKLIQVIINTILYYTSKDPDILKQINPEYEKSFRKLKTLTGRARQKRQDRLKRIPKNEHYIFGSTLELFRRRRNKDQPEMERITTGPTAQTSSEPTGMKRAAHKVTHHWRWQACGSQWKEHRWTYIDDYYTSGIEKETVGLYVTT